MRLRHPLKSLNKITVSIYLTYYYHYLFFFAHVLCHLAYGSLKYLTKGSVTAAYKQRCFIHSEKCPLETYGPPEQNCL